jgi:hypothetical protein
MKEKKEALKNTLSITEEVNLARKLEKEFKKMITTIRKRSL